MKPLLDSLARLRRCGEELEGPIAAELAEIADSLRDASERWEAEARRLSLAQADAIVHSAEIIAELEETRERLQQAHHSADEARKEAERLVSFGGILERSLNEIYIFDAESLHFVLVNQGARENLGYVMDELRERTPLDLQTDFTMDEFSAQIGPVKDGTEQSISFTTTHRRKNGSFYDVDVNIQADVYNEHAVFVAIVQDITLRKQADEEREQLQRQLVDASREAGMAEVASGVLHNVGNVLNSVNVSASLVSEVFRRSRVGKVVQASELIAEHRDDLVSFLTEDSRGQRFVPYMEQLAKHLTKERDGQVEELQSLLDNIEHIKDIVNMQQTYAKVGGARETLDVVEMIEAAMSINDAGLSRRNIIVTREFSNIPPVVSEKHKILQILVNLVGNATHALMENGRENKTLTLAANLDGEQVRISVSDNGIGIASESLTKIFSHGFTTKTDGHGFGLHSSALAAQQLGGSLSAHSDGPGLGATFTLRLPIEVTTSSPPGSADSIRV